MDQYRSLAASTGKSQLLIFNDLYLLIRNTEPKETGTLLVPLLVASTKIEDKVRLSKLQPPIELMIAAEEMVFGKENSSKPPRVIEGNRCGVLHLAAKQWDAILTILEQNGLMAPGSRKMIYQSILGQQARPDEIMQVRLPSNAKIWNRDRSVYIDPNNYPNQLSAELKERIAKVNEEIKARLGFWIAKTLSGQRVAE
jgi:hypothetical protein